MRRAYDVLLSVLSSPATYRALRYALAAIFIYAGAVKLGAPRDFAKVVAGYGLVPEALLPFMARALPAFEVAAGLGLLFDVRGSLGSIGAMTVLFMAVLTYGIRLGLDVDCGCYGPGDPEGEAYIGLRTALVRDVFLLVTIGYLYLWRYLFGVRPLGFAALTRRLFKPSQGDFACEKQ